MDDEIQLIRDGDGLAVIGTEATVERFLVSEGLPSRALRPRPFRSALGDAAGAAQVASDIAAGSGRWVKLTKESARSIDKYGLRESATTGLSTGVLKGPKGQIKGFVEFAKGQRSLRGNPAQLSNVAAVMAQLAMQQAMDEITDYLATIDEKLDDVLRAQEDAELAKMIGAELVITDAMTIRDEVGRVSAITWSKVQGTSETIATTQAYALRRLDALAEKMERKAKIGELAAAAEEAEAKARQWLAVLARCFQLQDAIAVLELDRVLDAVPEELDRHRDGIRIARRNRLELISRSTECLVARMNAAAEEANGKVLLHPTKSPAVVRSSNQVVTGVHDFHGRLGIESGRQESEARRWTAAAAEVRDKALETGAKGVDAARSLGNETLGRASSVKDKLADGIAVRVRRRRGEGNGDEGEPATEG
ncbi:MULTISPECIES: hypothetical protein [Streptomyces]|uniref:hypothetical protein n=1 Tax=Streptomyces TaxID=1883 RepID=UPI0016728397|nr:MULTISPECIES: hypothetical protein [Streptomyces]MBK3525379.1 hypothetical protein [Streptomyces sp. MBT70]GGR85043.1 hypothetical protein GCM10010236_44620 [Streptomyces eurythermus]